MGLSLRVEVVLMLSELGEDSEFNFCIFARLRAFDPRGTLRCG